MFDAITNVFLGSVYGSFLIVRNNEKIMNIV